MFQGKGKNAGKALNEHTKEELIQMVCHLKECKKFGLVWEDKPEQVAKDCQEKLPILREDKTKALTLDTEQPTNIIIEGDNYHALSVLNYTHAGKIDVIYIDPPYNTGNKDFVYNDKIVDTEDSYRHSKWLSFMEKRLRLAKNLLTPDGVIFISIDDNEQAYLKVLCDEIFGLDKFVSCLHIETSVVAGPRRVPAMQGSIVKTAEYVLCYINGTDTKVLKNLLYDYIPGYDTHYSMFFDKGQDKVIPLVEYLRNNKDIVSAFEKLKLKVSLDNLWKVMQINEEVKDFIYSELIASKIFRIGDVVSNIPTDVYTNIEVGNIFTYENKLLIKESDNKIKTIFKYKDRIGRADDYFSSFGERTVRGNLWKGFSSDGGNLAKEGGVDFKNGKKPVRLIKQLIYGALNSIIENPIILDFFAGSGTTGQAVLDLNKTDGGKRQFILCTNNENKIAEDVTYPRIKTVMTGNRPDGTKYSDGIPSNVRYFKTDFVSKNKTSDRLRREIAPLCTDMIKIRENCFESVIDTEQLKVLRNNRGLVALVFDDGDLGTYICQIDAIPTDAPVYLYVFSYNSDNRHYEIPDDASHEYISQPIPEGVLSVYRRIFQPKDK